MVRKIKKFVLSFIEYYPIIQNIKENYRFTNAVVNRRTAVTTVFNKFRVIVRPNDIDLDVLKSTFIEKYHRCPFLLPEDAVIVDLGSNVGYTLLDFRLEYPKCRLVGVEMDQENFKILEENVKALDRCNAVNAAIWKTDGTIQYAGKDAQSFAAGEQHSGNAMVAQAITIDKLLNDFNISTVDYLKMDIEGAEEEIFLASDFQNWLSKVRYISIEVHDTSKHSNTELRQKIKTVLEAAGFFVMQSSVHWSSLIAVNKHML